MNIEHQKLDSRQRVNELYRQVSVELGQSLFFDGPLTSRHATNHHFQLLCRILATPTKAISDWGKDKPIWFRMAANLRGDGGPQYLLNPVLGRIAALLLHAPAVPLSGEGDYSAVYARRNCRLAAFAILQVILRDEPTTRAAGSLVELTPDFKKFRLETCQAYGIARGHKLLRQPDAPMLMRFDPLGHPRWNYPAYNLAYALGLYESFMYHQIKSARLADNKRPEGNLAPTKPPSSARPWLVNPFNVCPQLWLSHLAWPDP